jgi:murein DD-endopeptidase MepM/ murein hydrolase activator NlpD
MARPLLAVAFSVASLLWQPAAVATDLDLIPPVDGPVIAHFEPPPSPYEAGHRGIDFGTAEGSTVVASADGIVSFAGQVGGSLFVSVAHGELRTTYSFLSAILVERDQVVVQGEPIALSGLGHPEDVAGGDHLHFGLRRGDEYLDPEPLLVAGMRRNLWRVVWLAS